MNPLPSPPTQPPLIREKLRQETELAAEVGKKLAERGFAPSGADPLKDALVHVFARYCDVLIERLNRVPQSHHEAFLKMLGATPAPAIPARVPLSFAPVKSIQSFTAVVPRSTQVSAPAEDKSDPEPLVLFKTTKDLTLVQAELKQAVAVDTCRLVRSDISSILSTPATAPAPVSAEAAPLPDLVPLERIFYIGQPDIIGSPKLTRLRIKLELDRPASLPPGRDIEWGIPSGNAFMPLTPELDSTANLTQSGELVFIPPEKWQSQTIASENMPWLACRLFPETPARLACDENKAYSALIERIEVSGYRSVDAVPPAGAFNNGIPLDISRDFFPLGERPKFGEVFYVLSEIFAAPGTRVVLDIKLTNPSDGTDSPIPPVSKKGNPKLRWEGHTARSWVALECTDGTLALTQDGLVEFQVPADARPVLVNGINGGWIRARLVNGNYSAEETAASPGLAPAHPPAIAAIRVTSIQELGLAPPERLVVESDLVYGKIDPVLPFSPFPVPAKKGLMLYLAFSAPRGAAALNGQTLSFYFVPDNGGRRVLRETDSVNSLSGESAAPGWQALTVSGWRDCKVTGSAGEPHSARIIEVVMPDGLSRWFGSRLDPKEEFFWMRIIWPTQPDQPSYLPPDGPYPRRLLLNTVLASQTLRLTDELLGSSNGRPRQAFHTLHNPIIGGATLQVHEPVIRTNEQSAPRFATTGPVQSYAGSIDVSRPFPHEEWIQWAEVEDFSNSDSHSRHYILDRLTGSVRFGDGINGRIPPAGANNIRMHEYHTGGGQRGNRPAATVTQLHTTIPYVESVSNPVAAAGGQDQEGFDSLNRGAATLLRHRDRAVSRDDYADLAVKASPEVARAKCVPACDVRGDSGTADDLVPEARLGSVCVIVVPRNGGAHSQGHDEGRPQPSFELLKNIKEFLDRRRPIGIGLTLLGPEYVGVDIIAELVWNPDRSSSGAEGEIKKQLNTFLHPTTGGPDGLGWDFGQRPHASDFYPLLGAIEGLDYIRSLELRFKEERLGLLASGVFLVCPGTHEIRLC